MKPIQILLLFLLCSVTSVFAQPVLTTAQSPQDQDGFKHTYLDVQNLSVGPAGANVTWDYSAAVPNGTLDSGKYEVPLFVPPSNYPYNMAYIFRRTYNGSGGNTDYFDYYISTLDSLTRVGMDYNIPDFHPFTFTNPAPQLRFPMTYGDAWHETNAGHHQSIIGTQNFIGISDVKADGYGTLILPNATLNNVLRIHVLDTLFEGGPGYEFASTYYFYQPQQRYPVLVHSDRNIDGAYAWIGSTFGVTGVAEEAESISVSVFPNPITIGSMRTEMRITWESPVPSANLRIINLKGQIVKEAVVRSNDKVGVKELESGMYFVHLAFKNGGQSRQKVLIMH